MGLDFIFQFSFEIHLIVKIDEKVGYDKIFQFSFEIHLFHFTAHLPFPKNNFQFSFEIHQFSWALEKIIVQIFQFSFEIHLIAKMYILEVYYDTFNSLLRFIKSKMPYS